MNLRLLFGNLALAMVLVALGQVAARSETSSAVGIVSRTSPRTFYGGTGHPLLHQSFEETLGFYVQEGNAPVAYGVPQTQGSGAYWGRIIGRAATGLFSAWAAADGPNAPPSVDYPVPIGTNTTMTTGPFDLTPFVEAELAYDLWLSTEYVDLFSVQASVDGLRFFGYTYYGTSQGFEDRRLNLRTWPALGDLTNYSTVWFRFGYSSDLGVRWEGVYIDNVELLVREPGELFSDGFLLGDSSRWSWTVG